MVVEKDYKHIRQFAGEVNAKKRRMESNGVKSD